MKTIEEVILIPALYMLTLVYSDGSMWNEVTATMPEDIENWEYNIEGTGLLCIQELAGEYILTIDGKEIDFTVKY